MKQLTSERRPFYLMYEIESRELRSRFFAATKIAPIASKVVIFQHSELYKIALFSRPGNVLIKSSSYTFFTALRLMKIRGFQIFQHQEEGIHLDSKSDVPLTMSRQSNNQCDHYLAWHENDARVAQLAGFKREQIAIVGNMRFEYLKHRKRDRRLNTKKKLRILVLTNFDYTKLIYRKPKKGNLDEMVGVTKVQESLAEQAQLGHQNQALYSQLFEDSRLNHFDVKIRRYFYETRNPDGDVLKIATDGNLNYFDSLDTADIVLHYGSTGGLEGVFLGLPSLILTSDVSSLNPAIASSSTVFTNLDDLFETLHKFDRDRSSLQAVSSAQMERSSESYGFRLEESKQIDKLIQLSVNSVHSHSTFTKYGVWFTAYTFYLKSRIRIAYNFLRRVESVRKASKLNDENLNLHLEILKAGSFFEYRIQWFGKIVNLRLKDLKLDE